MTSPADPRRGAPARPLPSARPSFIESDHRLARVAAPVVRFLHVESAGGILLLAATLVALVWANSPWRSSYAELWQTRIVVEVGGHRLEEDLGHVVNDALMTLFFFVVGMEIKREMAVGELRDPRRVALPALAALGGMVVPAAVFLAFNAGTPGARGWGIPMATDIAFALGVLALVGRGIPESVKLVLLTLAIVDDIGAIAVIAVVYSSDLNPGLILAAAGVLGIVVVLVRLHVTAAPVYALLGLSLWLLVFESGVHATVAGVALGLVTPARARQTDLRPDEVAGVVGRGGAVAARDIRRTADAVRGSVSACDRLIDALHPWTSYLIVPVFALANAGVELTTDAFTPPSRVFAGVTVGLVAGKLIGITSFGWLAVRTGIGRLPPGVGWSHLAGLAAVAGIGFTVSLFVTALAFDDPAFRSDAKIGILVASVVAAGLGALILAATRRRSGRASG